MRTIGLLLISLFLINCSTPQLKQPQNDVVLKLDSHIQGKEFVIIEGDDKKLWKLRNLNTGQEFTMNFTQMKIRNAAYRNWMTVQKQKPEITKIETTEFDYVFYFNYIDPQDNKSVLGGKFSINKKYVKSADNDLHKYLIGGGVVLGIELIVAILIIVL